MSKVNTGKELQSLREELISKYDSTKTRIRICSTGCRARGALKIRDAFHKEIKNKNLTSKVEIVETGCQGLCAYAPVVSIDPAGIFYGKLTEKDVPAIIESVANKGKATAPRCPSGEPNRDDAVQRLCYTENKKIYPEIKQIPFFKSQNKIVLRNCGYINPTSLNDYIRRNGYAAIAKVLTGMKPEDVIDEVIKSGLRGRGGAGFPTGLKWKFASEAKRSPPSETSGGGYKSVDKYFICNGDEGDPGAFMDRAVLEGDPHSVIEGMMIGAYAIGANHGYIYVRAEYPIAVEYSTLAVNLARESGLLGENIIGSGFNFDITIKQGAGAFVCGEETALMASIEGKRGMPRPRPPFPAESGLWGKPTVINNVETLANIPYIILESGNAYASLGTKGSKGTKVFALAGRVKNTGLVEVPMGITLRQIIFEMGGGIEREKEFKAVQMGGPSGGCLPAKHLDTPIDYETIKEAGAIMGSGGMIVMDNTTCMVDIARYFLDFVQKESCGKCVPCRIGTKRMLEIVTRFTEGKAQTGDIEKLQKLAESVRDTSLCGLGQTAPNPVLSTIQYFRDEYESHLRDKFCPSGVCKGLFRYEIDVEKCTGCGLCLKNCPAQAIEGNKKQPHKIIQDQCETCGICVEKCRFNAISPKPLKPVGSVK
ncbi:MAG: NADH-quinone oxidoreductase subunit NuoF [Planctomycetota bacterium]